MVGWILSLLLGALGGNLAGAIMKEKSLGTLGNSIAGVLGGGIGNALLGMVGFADAGVIGSVLAGLLGGGVLLLIVALVRGGSKA